MTVRQLPFGLHPPVSQIVAALYIVMLVCAAGVSAQVDNCIVCHLELEDSDGPAHKSSKDIHFRKGLSCVDCHGGDADLEDMEEVRMASSYRGVPDHLEVPVFCARCHSNASYMRDHNPSLPTDQFDKYRASAHGKLLLERRDPKAADCISCHWVHEMGDGKSSRSSTHPTNLPYTCGECHADADYMAEYGIPTGQMADFEESVHGQALLERASSGAPACNDCHSNHGTALPGMRSPSGACGNCHAIEMQLFMKSPHRVAFAENDLPICETCHSNHRILKPTDRMLGTHEDAICTECHSSDDGTSAFTIAENLSFIITRLVSATSEATALLDEARVKGMVTTDEEFLLKEVNQALVRTRTLVHSLDPGELIPVAEAGIAKADTVRLKSSGLVQDYYTRRRGLALATIFITVVVAVLYLKIRELG